MNDYQITFDDSNGVRLAGKILLTDEFVALFEGEHGFQLKLDPIVQRSWAEWDGDGQQVRDDVRLLGFTLRFNPAEPQDVPF